jgi:hypothetical protein
MDGRLITLARSPRAVLAMLTAIASLTGSALAIAAPGDPAPQDRWPVGGAAIATAMEIAATHWAAVPCSGRVDVRWAPLAAGVGGRSTWAYAGDDGFRSPARNTDCEIELSTLEDWDWAKVCTVLVHEVGHLTGHRHADDPHDVMNAAYVEPVADCAAEPEPDPGSAVVSSYRSSLPVAPPVSRPKTTPKPPAAKTRKPSKPAKRAKPRARSRPKR